MELCVWRKAFFDSFSRFRMDSSEVVVCAKPMAENPSKKNNTRKTMVQTTEFFCGLQGYMKSGIRDISS
jgi:hypothetical protein